MLLILWYELMLCRSIRYRPISLQCFNHVRYRCSSGSLNSKILSTKRPSAIWKGSALPPTFLCQIWSGNNLQILFMCSMYLTNETSTNPIMSIYPSTEGCNVITGHYDHFSGQTAMPLARERDNPSTIIQPVNSQGSNSSTATASPRLSSEPKPTKRGLVRLLSRKKKNKGTGYLDVVSAHYEVCLLEYCTVMFLTWLMIFNDNSRQLYQTQIGTCWITSRPIWKNLVRLPS